MEDKDSGETKQASTMKKLEDKLAAQTAMVQKMKLQNAEVQEKLDATTKELRRQERDLDAAEREKRK